jgi:tRNA(fMet)-specific endonuclease VapC
MEMRPIMVDTNAYTAFKRGDPGVIEVIQHAKIIGISPIVLGELLGGFDSGTKIKQNRDELRQFLDSSRIRIYELTADTANFYSQVYASLKRKGNPIPTNDLWIAAQALENGCLVCTFDKHFAAIDGLIAGKTLAELVV